MARNRKSSGFTAIRIEGGILPPEFLAVIAGSQAKHQAGSDYGLTRSLSLKEEIARYWRIANDLYTAYAERRDRTNVNRIEVGVDDWLVPLLKEVLGFDDLSAVRPITLGDRTFPITHVAFGGAVPVLLTTHEYDLDRADPRFGEEGRRRAPHGLMQELLNASDDALWGIVANGTKLRLLRDNPSLTRPAHIEADLDLIFAEQLYPDFAALWLLAHASRLKPVDGKASNAILERWRAEAHETGERALDHLRDGVTEALKQLGNGFLQHPENEPLRVALADGRLSAEGYFQELLRLVYRLLFLFTAEERDLLHGPGATDEQRAIYAQGYGLARLRDRALKRRHYDRHHDLWQGLKIVFRALASGEPALALPALGGLFAPEQCPYLEGGFVSNERLLEAIRALAFFRTAAGLARVNYRDMDTEELGSVYESLLELHPVIDVDATPWTFGFVGEGNGEKTKGSERKLTGSYYTPAALVNELIKSALEPVMADAIRSHPRDPRPAILNLKIVDPACGSGHFLLAAARRLAAEIARIEAGSDTPDEAARQHALREVVQHCIFGVDRNPLAVELCRTALWIETIEPGKPLSFLDHHIQCGDSLVGVLDPKIITQGIPDEAYKPLTGDDREICNALKKRNREAENRARHGDLFVREAASHYRAPAVSLDDMPEESLADVATKRERWQRLHQDPDYLREKHRADLFTAAFFAPKTRATAETVPVTEDLLSLADGQTTRPGVIEYAETLALTHRFFHWHLAFSDIMQKGGFDVVLGNPPWEVSQLGEEEYFAAKAPHVTSLKGAQRKAAISALEQTNPRLWAAYREDLRTIEATNAFVRSSGRYSLTAYGKLNLYALFAEHAMRLTNPHGRAGIIVQSGIATDDGNKAFFEEVSTNGRLVSFFDMVNLEGIFPGIHRTHPHFCLMTLAAPHEGRVARLSFYNTNTGHLTDARRIFTLSPDDILRINPNTKTAPVFRSNADAELTKKIYVRVPVLIDETKGAAGNPWGVRVIQNFFSTSNPRDQKLFADYEEAEADFISLAPVRRGAMINQFDHCAATYDPSTKRFIEETQKPPKEPIRADKYVPACEVRARLVEKGWTRDWLIGWRDITNATNERTVIASFLPIGPTDDTLSLLLPLSVEPRLAASLLGALNSLVLDYVAQQKVGGTHVRRYVLAQLPIPTPTDFTDRDLAFLVPRILELSYTDEVLAPVARDLSYNGPPFAWDPDRRALLRAELDAYFARLYGLTRDELRYILDPTEVYGEDYPSETFRVLKNNEIKQFGEYRTRRLVLEAWDRIERGELAAPSPAIRIAAVRTEPVDVSTLPDGAWARPMVDPHAETGAQLAAVLKAMGSPLPARQVRLAALLALEPRLLLPYLDDEEAATWRRLIGSEADPLQPGTPSFIARADAAWGAAVRYLRTNGHLVEEIQMGTWAPGIGVERFVTEGWPDGRASMVLRVLQRQATDTVIATLPTELRDWVDAAAA